jgi:hypothetical protein
VSPRVFAISIATMRRRQAAAGGAGEGEGLGHAQRMRGAEARAHQRRRRHAAYDAGRPARAQGIHQHRGGSLFEIVEERQARPVARHDPDAGRQGLAREALGHAQADGVVAVRGADTDHEGSHEVSCGSLRSISSVRKWVEHEMQGS